MEFLIVSTLAVALYYYFWETLPIERGLRYMTWGITILALGVAANYITKTPLKPIIVDLIGEGNLGYIRPFFYFPGSALALIGIISWFSRVVGYQKEIALRKKAQSQLRDKTKLIGEVLETSKHGILIFDDNFVVQLTNRRFLELLDIPEKLGQPGTAYKTLIQHMTEKGEYGDIDADLVYPQYLELTKNNSHIHFQRIRPNGVILDIEAKWAPGIGWISTYSDVTQQARAELELTKSEEKFRDFTESASDWLWELNEDLRFTYVSELGLTIADRTLEEIRGLSLRELFFQNTTDEQWEKISFHLAEKKPFKDLQYIYRHPDGTVRHFASSGKPIFNKSGVFCGYRGIGSDITARKQFEEQSQNFQKMEAIGRLSGGIAHDFNNLLAIIIGNTELLKEHWQEKYGENVPMLDVVEKAALRGADLTQQILAYSRRQQLTPAPVDLTAGMSGIIKLIGRSLGEDIRIEIHQMEGLWHALCDLGPLEDAIINLANNARDAMPRGGTLTISTSNYVQTIDNRRSEKGNLQPGDYILVSVEDTGLGIARETISQVFEPFFTTKDVGKGTGLGLSMVFGFAKQSNGHVTIESTLGTGTTVNLYLPRSVAQDSQLERTAAQ